MAYEKQTWANNPTGGTPISASRLNHIEDGLESASNVADNCVKTSGDTMTGALEVNDTITAQGVTSSGRTEDGPQFTALNTETGTSNYTYFSAKRTGTTKAGVNVDRQISFGVGSGGSNSGIWDYQLDDWLLYANKNGTSRLISKQNWASSDSAPSSNINNAFVQAWDSSGHTCLQLYPRKGSNGYDGLLLQALRYGTTASPTGSIYNGFFCGINADGTRYVSFDETSPWRRGISGSDNLISGVSLATGGTGTLSKSANRYYLFIVTMSLGAKYCIGVRSGTNLRVVGAHDDGSNTYTSHCNVTFSSDYLSFTVNGGSYTNVTTTTNNANKLTGIYGLI